MTLTLEPTAVEGRSARESLWRNRGAIAVVLALLGALSLLAVVAGTGKAGSLDPDAYDPSGAHALAVLLRDQGVPVTRTTDVPSTMAATTAQTTVFVPLPRLLSDEELAALANLPGSLVVAGGGTRVLVGLGLPAHPVASVDAQDLSAGCGLPAAQAAGKARLGGLAYEPDKDQADAVGCYAVDQGATLLSLPSQDTVLLGTADGLTNKRLGSEGNAALGLALLGSGKNVVWLVPAADRPVLGARPPASPNDLLPAWVRLAALQVAIAVAVLALWRARRLGRVVVEPLPVVVRAAETVEGRGRLYQAARARDTAGEALRGGARSRLARRLGGGSTTDQAVLVTLAAERTGRPAADVHALLYGPPPADDAALVRLADDLDALTLEVAGS